MKTEDAPVPGQQQKQQHRGLSGSAPEMMAEHTVKQDESLSHIALKYYGSASRESWMVIYEANKDTIGTDPSMIKPGMVLKIPKQA